MTELRREVPFFPNSADNEHCFQAALQMVLAYFFPERSYTVAELDEITGRASAWTWPILGQLYCRSLGIKIGCIGVFDCAAFAQRGYEYIVEFSGREVADAQAANCDLPQEMKNMARLLADRSVTFDKRVANQRDLRTILAAGGLTICLVNSNVLQGTGGYTGHFIVVTGVNDDGLWLHDPGLPPMKERFVGWTKFNRAWGYPKPKEKGALVFMPPVRNAS